MAPRASAGAVNHLSIFQTSDLLVAASKVKELGYALIASNSQAGLAVCDSPLNAPVALIIGGDTHGLDPTLLQLCDQQVNISMLGNGTTLNSAVSAGILLYEIRRQQRT